ncbi:FtsX-like permease family protein [Pseudomonas jinjuensis]|uniref:Putative ABC transport system permease protein n=1 Tax=Pseudomonas jinjuensis TaxID=198616 RepID=A0A1H0D9A5_9PSED|nr:ABC transporter permease [Pseudomonas jinjuensis]SDN66730.1 putative ABC transport system permease protein [Pseudomonas jinjuensis]
MTAFFWALHGLISHWRRHRVQFFSVLTGLWLATALWSGVQALNGQARESYARAGQLLSGAAQHHLVARDGGFVSQQDYVDLRLAGWPVSPLLQGRLRLRGHDDLRLQLIGIEPLTLPAGTRLAGQVASSEDVVAFIGRPGRTWIAPETLAELGVKAGAQLPGENGQTLPPLEERAQMPPGVLLVDIGAAQRLLDAPQRLSRLLLPGEFARGNPRLPAAQGGRLVLGSSDDVADIAQLTDSFHLNLTALGLLSFVVGMFIVHAAIGLALEQRRPLLRTLRACGVSLRMLIAALALELCGLALIGGMAGMLSGYWLASLLLPDVAASLRGLYGAEVAGQLRLDALWWFGGFAICLAGTLLAGAASLLRAARLPLLALARPEAWHQAQALWLRRQVWCSAILGLLALALLAFGEGLPAGFALLACLLLGAALVLPPCLNWLLERVSPRTRTPLAQWFVADSRQQLPALAMALMALLLALAANIGVGSMTEGFRRTFQTWLDQRLAAELYISVQDLRQAGDIGAWLQRQPQVRAVLPSWRVDLQLRGWPAQLSGVIDHPHYRSQWPLLESAPDAWERLARQDALMLSEQLARRLQLSLGDHLDLPTPTGEWQLEVVGIYADYGNPKGHLLVNAAGLRRYWPGLQPASFSLRLPAEAVPGLSRAVQQAFDLESSRVTDQVQLKSWSTRVFERTFAATAALNSLTLGVAGVALFISLLTLGQTRLTQLAPLWALGVSRAQLAWLSLGQTLLLALITLLLAVPLGLLLAWCLVAVVNVQAFGWRLPLQVFPLQILQLLAFALLATLVAAAWPLWRLGHGTPSSLLRTFSDER